MTASHGIAESYSLQNLLGFLLHLSAIKRAKTQVRVLTDKNKGAGSTHEHIYPHVYTIIFSLMTNYSGILS